MQAELRPQRLRALAVALAGAGVALLSSPPHAHPGTVRATTVERAFVAAVNSVRSSHGLASVSPSAPLIRAARSHSTDMVARAYFGHGAFSERLERFGVTRGKIGEDLAWTSPPTDPVDRIVQAWLASRAHRAVLLEPDYRQIGVGAVTGPFRGFDRALVVTADFHGGG